MSVAPSELVVVGAGGAAVVLGGGVGYKDLVSAFCPLFATMTTTGRKGGLYLRAFGVDPAIILGFTGSLALNLNQSLNRLAIGQRMPCPVK